MADYKLSAELSLKDKFTSVVRKAGQGLEGVSSKFSEVETKFDKAGNRIETITTKTAKSLDKFGSRSEVTTEKVTRTFDKMGKEIGKPLTEVSKKVNDTDAKFKKLFNNINAKQPTLDKLKSKLKGVGSSFAEVGKKALNFGKWAALGATASGVAGVKIAADYQTLASKMRTAFKGNEKLATEYFNWATEFADVTPFQTDEVIDATVQLKMRGFDPKKVLNDVGDMAAAMSMPLEHATQAFNQIKSGEWEMMKMYGLGRKEFEEEAKNMGMTGLFNKSGQQIVSTEKMMDAVVRVMRKKFEGGIKNLSNTASGQITTTLGNIKTNIANAFGFEKGQVRAGSVLDNVIKKLKEINELVKTQAFKDKIEEIGKKFDSWSEGLKKISLKDLMDNFDSLFKKIQRVAMMWAGFQLGMTFGLKGAAVGAVLGLISPELVDIYDKLNAEKPKPMTPQNPVGQNGYNYGGYGGFGNSGIGYGYGGKGQVINNVTINATDRTDTDIYRIMEKALDGTAGGTY